MQVDVPLEFHLRQEETDIGVDIFLSQLNIYLNTILQLAIIGGFICEISH